MNKLRILLKRLRVFRRLMEIETLVLTHQNQLSSLAGCVVCGGVMDAQWAEMLWTAQGKPVTVCKLHVSLAKKQHGLKTSGQMQEERKREERKREKQAKRGEGPVTTAGQETAPGAQASASEHQREQQERSVGDGTENVQVEAAPHQH